MQEDQQRGKHIELHYHSILLQYRYLLYSKMKHCTDFYAYNISREKCRKASTGRSIVTIPSCHHSTENFIHPCIIKTTDLNVYITTRERCMITEEVGRDKLCTILYHHNTTVNSCVCFRGIKTPKALYILAFLNRRPCTYI